MTQQEFERIVNSKKSELQKYFSGRMQKKVGATALAWYKHHYIEEEYYENGWKKWKKPKRWNENGSTSQRYGTLLSKRQHLFRSIKYRVTGTGAELYTYVPYAKMHNEGGTIRLRGTSRASRRATSWADAVGFQGSSVKIPRRPFLYPNEEVKKEVLKKVKSDIIRILKS